MVNTLLKIVQPLGFCPQTWKFLCIPYLFHSSVQFTLLTEYCILWSSAVWPISQTRHESTNQGARKQTETYRWPKMHDLQHTWEWCRDAQCSYKTLRIFGPKLLTESLLTGTKKGNNTLQHTVTYTFAVICISIIYWGVYWNSNTKFKSVETGASLSDMRRSAPQLKLGS